MRLVADIGGTTMRVAIGTADGTITAVEKLDTPASYAEGLRALIGTMDRLREGHAASDVVVGIAGVLAEGHRALAQSAHLPDWANHPLADDLESALSLPVALENDSALAALGEARIGAGKDATIVVYLGIGTGIGGARVVDGHIDRSAFGFEVGHQYLAPGTELEELVSGSAVERIEGTPAKEVTDPALWRDYAHQFAAGLYNTLLHWSPDVVVLGGSLMRDNGMRIDDIREGLERVNEAIPLLPPIVCAKLPYPGLAGALLLPVQS